MTTSDFYRKKDLAYIKKDRRHIIKLMVLRLYGVSAMFSIMTEPLNTRHTYYDVFHTSLNKPPHFDLVDFIKKEYISKNPIPGWKMAAVYDLDGKFKRFVHHSEDRKSVV